MFFGLTLAAWLETGHAYHPPGLFLFGPFPVLHQGAPASPTARAFLRRLLTSWWMTGQVARILPPFSAVWFRLFLTVFPLHLTASRTRTMKWFAFFSFVLLGVGLGTHSFLYSFAYQFVPMFCATPPPTLETRPFSVFLRQSCNPRPSESGSANLSSLKRFCEPVRFRLVATIRINTLPLSAQLSGQI